MKDTTNTARPLGGVGAAAPWEKWCARLALMKGRGRGGRAGLGGGPHALSFIRRLSLLGNWLYCIMKKKSLEGKAVIVKIRGQRLKDENDWIEIVDNVVSVITRKDTLMEVKRNVWKRWSDCSFWGWTNFDWGGWSTLKDDDWGGDGYGYCDGWIRD